MKTLDLTIFGDLLGRLNIKPRLKKDLKFVSSTSDLAADWSCYELLSITNRTGDAGVLLLQPDETLFVTQYELSRRIVDASTGRDRAIICDFCYTWQPGGNAASITFATSRAKRSVRFLCCADLACSQHVRTLTKASKASRAQLRENMTDELRVERLKQRLRDLVSQLSLEGLEAETNE